MNAGALRARIEAMHGEASERYGLAREAVLRHQRAGGMPALTEAIEAALEESCAGGRCSVLAEMLRLVDELDDAGGGR